MIKGEYRNKKDIYFYGLDELIYYLPWLTAWRYCNLFPRFNEKEVGGETKAGEKPPGRGIGLAI